MKTICLFLPLVVLIGLWGCASLPSNDGDLQRGEALTVETYRQKALAHERRGELLEARMAWQVAARLDPQNGGIPDIIQTLDRGIANAVAKHYRTAVESLDKGDCAAAQRHLLIVLRLDPGHRDARHYLKNCMFENESMRYVVQPGDSYTKIAAKIYSDPAKAEVIAYYNDLAPDKPLMIGKVLLLPSLDAQLMLPRADIDAVVSQAKNELNQKNYDTAIAIAAKITADLPGHVEARRITDQAHFEKGQTLIARQDYLAALAELKKVGAGFKSRDKAIANARQGLQQQATTEKMRMAQAFMAQKDYLAAINAGEEILTQDPGHATARQLLNAANYGAAKDYIEKGNDQFAIRHLHAIRKPYEDTDQLIAQIQGRLNNQAEAAYRRGVKHFINEDLEMAIKAWQQTLSINPQHPKAAQDMRNAIELLEKWKRLEKEQ